MPNWSGWLVGYVVVSLKKETTALQVNVVKMRPPEVVLVLLKVPEVVVEPPG